MRQIAGEELKKIQLQILDVVSAFCEEYHINYWLDCGTLLGAIRHKGYIPWDDDIDIGMLRPDYDRFMKLFNEKNKKYQFKSIENDRSFCYAYGKVLDMDTVLYEPDKNGVKLAINIDVFVYDNVPDDDRALRRMFRKRNLYNFCDYFHRINKPHGNWMKKLGIFMIQTALLPFPNNYFCVKKNKNAKKYLNRNTKRVGNVSAGDYAYWDKDILQEFTYAEFENKKYRIPVEYDKYLREFYGNYMELPPEEKRVTHHKFEAYIM